MRKREIKYKKKEEESDFTMKLRNIAVTIDRVTLYCHKPEKE